MLIVGVSTRCFRDDAALVVLLIHGGMCTSKYYRANKSELDTNVVGKALS